MAALRKSFVKLAFNPPQVARDAVHQRDLCNIYMTQDSIIANFHQVFGYRNDQLALRFYNILADGKRGIHIYLPTYCVKLECLLQGFPLQLNLFGFKLLDSKGNGEVFATDLADMITNTLALCPETQKDKTYPLLSGNAYSRTDSDKRCRCALY